MAAVGPWYPMYGQRFDASTAGWEIDAVGFYVRLLNYQWDNGSIPDDANGIRVITRVKPAQIRSLWWVITQKFPVAADGNRANRMMEKVRAEQVAKGGKRTTKARTAAVARWSAPSNAPSNANSNAPSNAVEQCSGDAIRDTRGKEEGNQNGSEDTPAAPSAESAPVPSKKKLTSQQQRVKDAEDVMFKGRGIEPPPAAVIAKWLSMVDELELDSIVDNLESSGKLFDLKGQSLQAYIAGCVNRCVKDRAELEKRTGQ